MNQSAFSAINQAEEETQGKPRLLALVLIAGDR